MGGGMQLQRSVTSLTVVRGGVSHPTPYNGPSKFVVLLFAWTCVRLTACFESHLVRAMLNLHTRCVR